jgi:outer membrane protein TolC
MHLLRIFMRSGLGCVLLYSHAALAENAALATPLSLQQAFEVGTTELQPTLFAVRAEQESAQADIQRAESAYALEADVNLNAARIKPAPNAYNLSPNDNEASLNIRKPLYDFGYTGARLHAAETGVEAEQLEYKHALAQQQIAITRSFFDAALSDIKFAWDNEAMATLYVRFKKVRDRFNLKQLSEVELTKAESDYQQMLTVRRNAEVAQRVTRAQLAETINRPGELSAQLSTPDVNLEKIKLPPPEALIKFAMQSNYEIRAQDKRVAAAQEAMDAARKQSRPTLGAEVKVSDYSRDLPSREDWRASLNLKIPLFENGLVKSAVAEKRALWLKRRAALLQLQSDVRKQIYQTWMQLTNLIVKDGELQAAAKAADRALDKSRGEYDLELRTDYGDTLVNASRVRYQKAKNNYDIIVTSMRLLMLIGQPPRSVIDSHKISFPVNVTGEANEN